jgi:P-type Cu+ transporter
MSSLEPYDVIVIKPITSYTDPVLTLSYYPHAPGFTIRTLIDAISAAKQPTPYTVSIDHPASIEERAKAMYMREQRDLLLRLIFTVIVAIPTFVIAVVYMSLVSQNNRIRRFFSEPMWTGNTSRLEWILFFLATPVMFYSAGMFHRRSLKEIRALWKKGSQTPILRRFTRFGSMNLLVSHLLDAIMPS